MIAGVLLAAGAGTRMGQPKALVRDESGPWLLRAVDALLEGGCDEVYVVLGAAVVGPRELIREEHLSDAEVHLVVCEDWAEGQSASLRAGLEAVTASTAEACVLTLVDLPDVGPEVVARVAAGAGPDTLARATYAGRPGHPVVLGRQHWAAVLESLSGDSGAKGYLAAREVTGVDCADLATGLDVDTPPEEH